MSLTSSLLSRVLGGGSCSREELIALSREPLEELCQAANAIREHFCGNVFDLCTIINGRSGKCSENCKYCAQSAHYSTAVEEYPLLSDEALLAGARYNDERGILRYSIVTSGKRLTDEDVDRLCASYRHIAEHCGISLCASHGLISKKHCEQLKAAGVSRYHNNLETSRRNFPNVCTTHTYDDKLQTIKWALEAGLEVCSGGIMGLGETMEDRIDMYMDIAALGIKSMPVNFLTHPRNAVRGHDPSGRGRTAAHRGPGAVHHAGRLRPHRRRQEYHEGPRQENLHVRSECRHLRRYAYHRRRHHPGRPGHAGGTGI